MTPQEQLANLHKLLDFWDSVLPEMVSPGLLDWEAVGSEYPCGAVACLGGHVLLSELFEGIEHHPSKQLRDHPFSSFGGPSMTALGYFGDSNLFKPRLWHVFEFEGTDHAVARARIVRAIERLEGVV